MPRKKVDQDSRQRAVQACAPCKASKRRCDCRQPCANCIKRQDTASCVYKDHLPRIAGRPKNRNVSNNDLPKAKVSVNGPSTASNMLWTSRGVQVYVGSSASLSFLVLLRETLTKYTGRSSFTDASHSSVMLENRLLGDTPVDCLYQNDEHVKLIHFYYAAVSGHPVESSTDNTQTSGILDVLPEINDVIQLLHVTDVTSPISSAVMHAILALGAQCRSQSEDRQCEQSHIKKARKAAFDALKDDQLDINMVRVFIIMAFYMFGACRRNTAFMYIGIAARASDALGLHLHPDSVRVWKSIRILDLLVAAILGRSPATMNTDSVDSSYDTPSHSQLCFDASFEVWTIVDQVVQEFYRNGRSDTALAKAYLNKLSKWSTELPSSVKSDPPQGMDEIQQREHVIGNIHVSCAYYYAVVIATRKFLITVLHHRLSNDLTDGETEIDQMARACVDSALLLVQTCREVQQAYMLLDNMCLLKAWIFAAGMIIGFAFFVDPETYTGLEQALLDACHVLQYLSILSPQAKQYFDILQALHKAALEHHQRQVKSSDEAPLVTKIFSLGQPAPEHEPFEEFSNNIMPLATDDELVFTGESMDSVAAQFWDELLLDREQYTM